jgi:hypothetical protein
MRALLVIPGTVHLGLVGNVSLLVALGASFVLEISFVYVYIECLLIVIPPLHSTIGT